MAQLTITKIIAIILGVVVLVSVAILLGIAFKDRIWPYFRDLGRSAEEPIKMILGML